MSLFTDQYDCPMNTYSEKRVSMKLTISVFLGEDDIDDFDSVSACLSLIDVKVDSST